jgi:hypothetical protein
MVEATGPSLPTLPDLQTSESERAIKYRRREMSPGGSFGVRMEGLNRLLGRVVNLK